MFSWQLTSDKKAKGGWSEKYDLGAVRPTNVQLIQVGAQRLAVRDRILVKVRLSNPIPKVCLARLGLLSRSRQTPFSVCLATDQRGPCGRPVVAVHARV